MKLINTLNNHLCSNNKIDFINTLKYASEDFFPQIDFDYAGSLYFLEFKSIYDDKESNLDLEDFINGIKVLNAIASINRCIDEKFNYNNNKNEELIESLLHSNAHLQDVNTNLINLYKNLFFKLKSEKVLMNDENNNSNCSIIGSNNLLTHSEIQECILNGNMMHEKEFFGKF